jgi:amidase
MFKSTNAKTIIQSKVAQRERGLSFASEYIASGHDVYLSVTGQTLVHMLSTHVILRDFLAAREIPARIEKGEWTASQVVEAYIARAALSAKITNCVTEGE